MNTQDLARLEELLSLESAPARAFTPEQKDEITALFDSAQDRNDLAELATRAAKELNHYGDNLRARYAMALYQEFISETDESGRGYHQLARELMKHDDWEAAREIILRALPLRPDYRLVRTLLEIWQHLPAPDPESSDDRKTQDLLFAGTLCPDSPDLLWYRSRVADEEARSLDAADLACEALGRFISVKEGDRAEEPLLRVLDADLPDVHRKLIKLVPRMAAAGLTDLFDATLELGWDSILRHGQMAEFARIIERAILKRKGMEWLRPTYVRTLAASLGGGERLEDFIRECGLDNQDVPFDKALVQFREMYGIRPGAFVEHHNFGIGRITGHDGQFLVIDFVDKPSHRLAMEIARRSLRSLPDKCLRVSHYSEPEAIRFEIAKDPVAILVRALLDLGGEAAARELRECLVAHTIPEGDWTNWWKRARDASVEDPRIDASQSFRQVYRLAVEGVAEEAVKLPPLPTKTTAQSLTMMVEKFLRQHPEMEEQAKAAYAGELSARAKAGGPQDAVTAVPLLMRWCADEADTWKTLAASAFRREPGVAGGINAEDQLTLLRLGLAGDKTWHDAAMSAIASRFPQVREEALNALREGLGEGFAEAMRDELLSRDWRVNTRLALARLMQEGAIEDVPMTPWELLVATVNVLSSNPSPKIRAAGLELLDPQDRLGHMLTEAEWDDENWETFYRATRELAGSETGLEPISFMLVNTGHRSLMERVLRESEGARDPISVHFDSSIMLMSRATYEANLEKIADLEHQLSGVIPAEIGAARALGDLSENAEYHAARERQGIADATMRALKSQMQNARIIEDMPFPEDVVVAGTEVKVRDLTDDTERVIWLLGQGDSVQDENVINYLAPLGQVLVGKTPGDTAELDVNGHLHHLEVISVVRKLP